MPPPFQILFRPYGLVVLNLLQSTFQANAWATPGATPLDDEDIPVPSIPYYTPPSRSHTRVSPRRAARKGKCLRARSALNTRRIYSIHAAPHCPRGISRRLVHQIGASHAERGTRRDERARIFYPTARPSTPPLLHHVSRRLPAPCSLWIEQYTAGPIPRPPFRPQPGMRGWPWEELLRGCSSILPPRPLPDSQTPRSWIVAHVRLMPESHTQAIPHREAEYPKAHAACGTCIPPRAPPSPLRCSSSPPHAHGAEIPVLPRTRIWARVCVAFHADSTSGRARLRHTPDIAVRNMWEYRMEMLLEKMDLWPSTCPPSRARSLRRRSHRYDARGVEDACGEGGWARSRSLAVGYSQGRRSPSFAVLRALLSESRVSSRARRIYEDTDLSLQRLSAAPRVDIRAPRTHPTARPPHETRPPASAGTACAHRCPHTARMSLISLRNGAAAERVARGPACSFTTPPATSHIGLQARHRLRAIAARPPPPPRHPSGGQPTSGDFAPRHP
ncbi:hypothetical protein DFH07DRAFT_1065044 [Mycena maculata]|uniref:Uncharacterized protein n=1 Tax=Mycena maculata TaxID=230809 RepID=A0AAD7I6N6_9AGAR|nr:hypothetical protein DFH07DRAFT_1065044 [Mycena maculata]